VLKHFPQVVQNYEQLLADNFAQDCFVSPAQIEVETRERLQKILVPRLELGKQSLPAATAKEVRVDDDFA
jgi:hypothetical protein